MKSKSGQTQHQLQQQVQTQSLSPQQVMLVRLTEMPLEALQQRVEIECLENPWLERKDEAPEEDSYGKELEEAGGEDEGYTASDQEDTAYDYSSEDDIPDYLLRQDNGRNIPENIEYGETFSFYDQLKEQLAEFDLTEHQRTIAEYLIGSLEDDGLLKKPLIQVADELEIYQRVNTNEKELEQVLQVIWQFDPAGVGARSLRECLTLQIKRDKRNPFHQQMLKVMEKCYDDFIHKRWNRIQSKLHLSDIEAEMLQREMLRLNPKPGSALGEPGNNNMQQITPDFIVETDDYGHISLTLNQGNVPTLIVSPDATEKLEAYEQQKDTMLSKAAQEDILFTRQYVERGQMFINALAIRRETLLRTMHAIIQLQRPFFLEGDETLLRSMILEDVAEKAGYDISTISRVCNSKYVQTTYGTYPLKWFFSRGSIQNGKNDVSSRKVMAVLKEVIEKEDKNNPLSDEKLTALMKQKGYNIARRTVAKYREQMGYPAARLRK